MINIRNTIWITILVIFQSCSTHKKEISGNKISINFTQDIQEDEWFKIDGTKFILLKPDTLSSSASLEDMDNIGVNENVGYMSPTYTYTKRGNNWVDHKLTRGVMASNFVRLTRLLKLDQVYLFEGNKITVLMSGKVILSRKDGEVMVIKMSEGFKDNIEVVE
ncbi:MAG: hypothetical protein OEW67_06645 [Cyclobacteriaceae bacterium]|nr:hypothetical protein [Cyclobacteriaceae bacterium]